MARVIKHPESRPRYGGKYGDFHLRLKIRNDSERFDHEAARTRMEETRDEFYKTHDAYAEKHRED